MEQVIVKDGFIIQHIDAPHLAEGAVEVEGFEGVVGSRVEEYDSEWKLLPLSFRVEKGYVRIPDGYKLDSERFVVLTEDEKIVSGLLPLPAGMVIDNGSVRVKTLEDMVSSGEITHTEYADKKNETIKELRRMAYSAESDHLFFEEQRGDVAEGTWLQKIDEIKRRYPKVV